MYFKLVNDSIDKAVSVMDSITTNAMLEEKRQEVFITMVNAIHAISDCEERIRDVLHEDQKGDYLIKAFLYINNQIKHDKELQFFHFDVCGSIYPMRYPYLYGEPSIFWSNFENHGSPNARGKRKHYDEMLVDKEIKYTLLEIQKILNKYNRGN